MATVVVLPEDMMEDILSRLPIKSLERLRCMSKSSNSLISTQHFAMQVKRASQSPKSSSQKLVLSSPSPPYLRSLDYEKENRLANEGAISRLVFPAKTPHNILRIVGSCHGLLCLAFPSCKDIYLWNPLAFRSCEDIYLWNPFTGDYNKLSDPCLLPDKHSTCTYSFVYGFGYDSFSDDYKVLLGIKICYWTKVELLNYKTGIKEKFAIFSMREKGWRIIRQLPHIELFDRQFPELSGSKFVNGTLYWLVMESGERKGGDQIVAFDLKAERFLELPLPDIDTTLSVCSGLGVLEGRLCLSVATRRSSSYLIELWVMNEYDGVQSWTRLLNSPFEAAYLLHFPLCISKDNQVLFANGESKFTKFDATERRRPNIQSVGFRKHLDPIWSALKVWVGIEQANWIFGQRKTEECHLCKCKLDSNHYVYSNENPSKVYSYQCEAITYLESLVSPNF